LNFKDLNANTGARAKRTALEATNYVKQKQFNNFAIKFYENKTFLLFFTLRFIGKLEPI